VDFDGGTQSSDVGLLTLREAAQARCVPAMLDRRDPARIQQKMFGMVMARASAMTIPG
jgi:hypothetical protein